MHAFHIFCICTYSAQLSVFHTERRSRNTLIIIITEPEIRHGNEHFRGNENRKLRNKIFSVGKKIDKHMVFL